MKTILILLTTIGLLSCAKPDQPEPEPRQFKAIERPEIKRGTWAGELQYDVPGLVNQTIYAQRTLTTQAGVTISEWCNIPVSVDTIEIVNRAYTVNMTQVFAGSCNGIPADTLIMIWTGSGRLKGDTLIESGRVDFVRTYRGRVFQSGSGVFMGWFIWWR